MTPSHASRPNRRYRYYVTRPDTLDGSPAWRVPAHDLEALVCRSIADRLAEPGFILDLMGEAEVEAGQLQRAMVAADLAAATLRSGTDDNRIELLQGLVERIDMAEDCVVIALNGASLVGLGVAAEPPETGVPVLSITMPAARSRRGQQMRLMVPGPEQVAEPPKVRRDDKLIALVAEAMQTRELVLANPGRSINSIASEHGRCRTRMAKLVGLSCLAPHIVVAILEGRQPEGLDARRLATVDLSKDWVGQTQKLGF